MLERRCSVASLNKISYNLSDLTSLCMMVTECLPKMTWAKQPNMKFALTRFSKKGEKKTPCVTDLCITLKLKEENY